jgi:coenzyme F420-0:L-glutamate ligase / coenzyme F420-1:gamma-L-glutamate ligase
MSGLQVLPVEGLPEIEPGDQLADLIVEGLRRGAMPLEQGDVLVVAQKVVSKAEGRLRRLGEVTPGAPARRLAMRLKADPRMIQVVLDESVRVVRRERVLIVETHQGYVCANGGVDHSNVPGEDTVTLLPEDADRSAARLRDRLHVLTSLHPGVIVADTFGRPWRTGIQNVALGLAGIPGVIDYRGQRDDWGKELRATVVAVADELASAAELVMGKTARVPVALIRGYHAEGPVGSSRDLLMPAGLDLFR